MTWPPRPTLSRAFYKAHGLGNDYLVFEEGDDWVATPEAVRAACDRHRGAGSDGIVVSLRDSPGGALTARMFNPDGSEFERSGNGLRILASYLWRHGRVTEEPFSVSVAGDVVQMTIHEVSGTLYDVSVDMGRASIGPASVGLELDTLDDSGRLLGPGGRALHVVPVSVGNPHMVVFVAELTDDLFKSLGPFLATHPGLSNGANVQLAVPPAGQTVRIAIWERGVGPTSASGTSACAVAVAAVSEGLIGAGEVTVESAGGTLRVSVTPDLDVVLRGPVEEVCEGALANSWR